MHSHTSHGNVTKTAIGYVRVSTQEQATEGVSLDTQRDRLRIYCKSNGIKLIDIGADEGISGSTLNRPGLQAALQMIKRGRANTLLVAKLDRLSRSLRDVCTLLDDYFTDERYHLLSVCGMVNTHNAAGRMLLMNLANFNQFEREMISERTRETLQHMKAQGIKPGQAPYGYEYAKQVDDKGRRKLVPLASEQEVVGRIAAFHAADVKLAKIARRLNADHIPARQGGAWCGRVVSVILQREGKRQTKPYTPRVPRSTQHEAPLAALREFPKLLLQLVKEQRGAPLPADVRVREQRQNFSETSVTEYRADAVFIIEDSSGKALVAVIVEVQRKPDEDKPYRWLRYAARVHDDHRCDTHLLVDATDETTARWAQRPITSFLPGRSAAGNAPMVLSPAMLPKVASVEAAQKQPGQSILAALLHAGVDGEIQEAYQTLRALHDTAPSQPEALDRIWWLLGLLGGILPLERFTELQRLIMLHPEIKFIPRTEFDSPLYIPVALRMDAAAGSQAASSTGRYVYKVALRNDARGERWVLIMWEVDVPGVGAGANVGARPDTSRCQPSAWSMQHSV